MREILFRGKRDDNLAWIEGYVYRITETQEMPFLMMKDNHGITYPVYPETVGQYTGLEDKNGKKIFEGDVIRAHYANVPPERSEHVEKVVFRNGRFCGMCENGTMKTWAGLPDGVNHLSGDKSVWMNWCEVIGNIHDNPELIGGTE